MFHSQPIISNFITGKWYGVTIQEVIFVYIFPFTGNEYWTSGVSKMHQQLKTNPADGNVYNADKSKVNLDICKAPLNTKCIF